MNIGWAFASDGTVEMDIVNLPYFYNLGHQLHKVAEQVPTNENRIDVIINAMTASASLRALLNAYSDVSVVRTPANGFIAELEKAVEWVRNTPSDQWRTENATADSLFLTVVRAAKDCETVLLAELQTLTAYHPRQKGIYSTPRLISQAEQSLPPTVVTKLRPEAIEEIRQAGQCLAFDLPTACGFHMMRAAEAVLHDYYVAVCKPKSKRTLDNWGAYITALHKKTEENSDPDVSDVKEVLAILQQLKDSHRNLIMHPEVILSEEDAHTLFEVAKGGIIAMGQRMKVVNGKTEAVPTA